MTVVDSGVVVDVMLGRLDVEQLGTEQLAAPHLLDIEFLHVMRRHNRRGLLDDDRASRLVRRVGALAIERHPVDVHRHRIWELRHNLTAYDAAYVALAEELGMRLLTTDARIVDAPGLRCTVEVL